MKNIRSTKYILIGVLVFYSSSLSAECIGVVTAGGGQGFWGDVEKGAEKAGIELGIETVIRGPVDEGNIEGQRAIIKSIMKMQCNGYVIAPNTIERREDVSQLKSKGIPTVYIDRDVGGERISVIKTENFSAGELAGIEMAQALGGSGNVAIFRMNKDVITTTFRENGFIKGATKGGLRIIVDQYLGTTVGEARGKASEILSKVNGIDGIFTPNESTSLAVLKSLQYFKKTNQLIHIGFDAHDSMIKALETKNMYGFIVQRPFQMGYLGVHTIYQSLQRKSIDKEIDTGVIFVNQKNIFDPDIRKLLSLKN
ncbi:MAG: substrate-binding domain-containing protein [SAR324 cluster bacterium]|nr:substrate-binding domain-containing protein [SAR324 cluster bacterium]